MNHLVIVLISYYSLFRVIFILHVIDVKYSVHVYFATCSASLDVFLASFHVYFATFSTLDVFLASLYYFLRFSSLLFCLTKNKSWFISLDMDYSLSLLCSHHLFSSLLCSNRVYFPFSIRDNKNHLILYLG